MDRKWLLVCSSVAVVAITAAVTYSVSYSIAMNKFNEKVAEVNERQAMYTKLSELDQDVRQKYLGQINEEELTDAMCKGYIDGLSNKYSLYLSADEYQSYSQIESGKYIGIGVNVIKNNEDNLEIVYVENDSPASKAGIYKGDIIKSIDGKTVDDLSLYQSKLKLYGSVGSSVSLSIERKEASENEQNTVEVKSYTITVNREKYKEQTIDYRILNEKIGYVSISNFISSTPKDYERAVNDLISKGCQSFVIDLRNCMEGNVEYASEILDSILPQGDIISTIDKNSNKNVISSSSSKHVDYPISILVNNKTTGAAELFASSIKDYDRGSIIGEITAGETVKKEVLALSDGSAAVIPTAHYVTLKGEILTGKGLTPTKYVDLNAEQRASLDRHNLQDDEDLQLKSAIEELL